MTKFHMCYYKDNSEDMTNPLSIGVQALQQQDYALMILWVRMPDCYVGHTTAKPVFEIFPITFQADHKAWEWVFTIAVGPERLT